MARLTKAQRQETIYFYYGINRKTLEVNTVYQTRGGMLERWGEDMSVQRTPVGRGRQAESECVIVFGLGEVSGFPISMQDSETAKKKYAELQQKVLQMKSEKGTSSC